MARRRWREATSGCLSQHYSAMASSKNILIENNWGTRNATIRWHLEGSRPFLTARIRGGLFPADFLIMMMNRKSSKYSTKLLSHNNAKVERWRMHVRNELARSISDSHSFTRHSYNCVIHLIQVHNEHVGGAKSTHPRAPMRVYPGNPSEFTDQLYTKQITRT